MLAFSLSSVSAIDKVKWHDGTLARFILDKLTIFLKSLTAFLVSLTIVLLNNV